MMRMHIQSGNDRERKLARSKRTDEIRRVLGPYQTWSLMFSRGDTQVERSTWKCGCTMDCVGNGRDNRRLAIQWDRCGNQIGRAHV